MAIVMFTCSKCGEYVEEDLGNVQVEGPASTTSHRCNPRGFVGREIAPDETMDAFEATIEIKYPG